MARRTLAWIVNWDWILENAPQLSGGVKGSKLWLGRAVDEQVCFVVLCCVVLCLTPCAVMPFNVVVSVVSCVLCCVLYYIV